MGLYGNAVRVSSFALIFMIIKAQKQKQRCIALKHLGKIFYFAVFSFLVQEGLTLLFFIAVHTDQFIANFIQKKAET